MIHANRSSELRNVQLQSGEVSAVRDTKGYYTTKDAVTTFLGHGNREDCGPLWRGSGN